MCKSVLLQPVYLIISLAVGIFLTGCSGNSSDSAATQTQTSASSQFYDPPLRMLGELDYSGDAGTAKRVALAGDGLGGNGRGLPSWLIRTVLEGLQEGITSGSGATATGRLFDSLKQNSLKADNAAALYNQAGDITIQASLLSNDSTVKINRLYKLPEIREAKLLKYFNPKIELDISNAAATISKAWDSDGDSYLAIAKKSSPTLVTGLNVDLNTLVGRFIQNQNNSTESLKLSSNNLKDLLTEGILMSFVEGLVYNGGVSMATDDAIKLAGIEGLTTEVYLANQAYVLLQHKFAQILTYQLKALIMIIEMDNYNDPTGELHLAKDDIEAFKTTLQNECANFEEAVDFLMINMVDYRTSANYAAESRLMHKYGLATDKTYRDIFATSRMFVAQLNRNSQKNYGLHGAIVLPNLYRYPASGTGPVSPGPITLKFRSYSSAQLGFSNYSSTITVQQPAPNAGRFPYTAWKPAIERYTALSYPDNNWLLYKFSPANDFPAGKYHMILVDKGDKTAPWSHTETLFGNISVLWYDPYRNISAATKGTFSQTTTNVIKFGVFSGRWNWGYNMISMSPWVVPSTVPANLRPSVTGNAKDLVSNPYNGRNTYGDNPGASASTKYTSTNEFYSTPLRFGMLVNPFPSWEPDEYFYTTFFPFAISKDSALRDELSRSLAGFFYNSSVNIVANQFKVYYSYVFNNIDKNTTEFIDSFMDESFSKSFLYSKNYPDTISKEFFSRYTNTNPTEYDDYKITFTAELNSNYPCLFGGCGERSGSITLDSDIQVIYYGTYGLPRSGYKLGGHIVNPNPINPSPGIPSPGIPSPGNPSLIITNPINPNLINTSTL